MISTDTNFETKVSLEKEAVPIPEVPPFHILFLGNYSGRENSLNLVENQTPNFKIYEIDRDNFEEVMTNLKITLHLDFNFSESKYLTLKFNNLDDFHPDNLFQQVSLFDELRSLRKRLHNPESYHSAAREVMSWYDEKLENDTQTDVSESSSLENNQSSGDLLDDILSGTKTPADSYQDNKAAFPELRSFISDIVKPHIIQTDETEQTKLLSIVDNATTELMRKILHHPHFQALESAWRGLYFVVRQTETSSDLKLFFMDISKSEVSSNLKSAKDLTDSSLFQKIVVEYPQISGGESFAMLCGNYEFEINVEDVTTLIRLAKIGNIITAPFISSVKPQMLGIQSLYKNPNMSDWNVTEDSNESKLWATLRSLPQASSLGMTIPKFLVRLPYGQATDPTELFYFEEFADNSEHQKYLWGNTSYLVGLLFAQTYRSFSWDFDNRIFSKIEDLPLHIYNDDGEAQSKSCSEIYFSENVCDSLIEQGFIPFLNFNNSDIVQVVKIQSIAFPSKPLYGRWE